MFKEKLKRLIYSYNREMPQFKVSKTLMLIWELQLASLFVSSMDRQQFDSKLLQTLSHINFWDVWRKLAFSQATLVYICLGVYAVILGLQVHGFIQQGFCQKVGLKKIYSLTWAIQRNTLFIPTLCGAIYILNSSASTAASIVSGIMIPLIMIVNVIPNELRLELPFDESFLSKNQERLNLVFAVISVCAKQFYLASLYPSTIPIGLYVVLQVLAFSRIVLELLNSCFSDDFSEAFRQLIPLLPQYVLCSEDYLTFSSNLRIPWLIIMPLACKLLLRARKAFLKLSVLGLSNGLKSQKCLISSIKRVFFHYENIKYLESHSTLEILGLLTQSNDLFAEERSRYLSAMELNPNSSSELLYLQPLRSALHQFIERFYSHLLKTSINENTFEVRLSKIQFLATYADKPIRALIEIAEMRRAMNNKLGLIQAISLDLVQARAITTLENSELRSSQLNLNEYLESLDYYSQTKAKVMMATKEKIAMLHLLIEPICNLDQVKQQAIKIFLECENLRATFQKTLQKGCYLMDGLHRYFQLSLLETTREDKLHQGPIERLKEYFDKDTKIEQRMLLNITSDSKLSLAVFSINDSNFGELIDSSPNFLQDLGFDAKRCSEMLRIDCLYPQPCAAYYKALLHQIAQDKLGFLSEDWQTSFLCQLNGALIETKLQIKLDFFYDKISVVFYHLKVQQSLPFIIYKQSTENFQEVVGVSSSTFESLGTKNSNILNAIQNLQIKNSCLEMKKLILGYQHNLTENHEKCGDLVQHMGKLSLREFVSKEEKRQTQPEKQKSFEADHFVFPMKYTVEELAIGDSQLNQICFRVNIVNFIDIEKLSFNMQFSALGSNRVSLSDDERTHFRTLPIKFELCDPQTIAVEGNGTEMNDLVSPTNVGKRLISVAKSESIAKLSPILDPQQYIFFSERNSKFKDNKPKDSLTPESKETAKRFKESKNSSTTKQSNQSSRRNQVRALVSRMSIPSALNFANYLGHFVAFVLITMVIASYAILDGAFNEFSEFANVAPFPSYFTSVVKAVDAVTEQAVLSNLDASLISTYDRMRSTIYSDFYGQQKDILSIFDRTLYVAVIMSVGIALLVTVIVKKIEEKEINLLRQLATISPSLITQCLEDIKSHLLNHRICERLEMEKLGLWLEKGKISSKKMMKTYRKKARSTAKVLLGCLICVVFIVSFYLITNIYYKKQTSYTVPLIDNIKLFSDAVPYAGWSSGFIAQIMSSMDNPGVQADIAFYVRIMEKFKNVSQQIVQTMQTINTKLLDNPYVSDVVKERYANITTIKACDDIKGTPNYNGCLKGFNFEAQFGFSSLYSRCYEYTAAVMKLLLRNFTHENMVAVCNDPQQLDRAYFSIASDQIMVNNIELEGANLSDAMASIKRSLLIYMFVGLVAMSSGLVLIWRPFYKKLVTEAINNKKVFTVIPIKLIEENNYIKTALKRQGSKI